MQPGKLEKQLLKEGNTYIVGTACVGETNYVGPIVSCSVVMDYNKLTPYFNNLLQELPLDVKGMEEILKSLKYYIIKIVSQDELNELNDQETALYYANFCAVNKLIWKMLADREVPEVFITKGSPLKEVVKSSYDSLHSANKSVSNYMIWDNPPTLNMLAPKAEYYASNAKSILCTNVAYELAKRQLRTCLREIDKKIPQYDIINKPQKEQVAIVSKLGNTQYHRLYIKELAKYPINTLIKEVI